MKVKILGYMLGTFIFLTMVLYGIYIKEIEVLIPSSILLAAIQIKFYGTIIINNKSYNLFYISMNHEFYFNGNNIFENKKVIAKRTAIRYRIFLRNKLSKDDYCLCTNKEGTLKFRYYELKNNMQLIVIKSSVFKKNNKYSSMNDFNKNCDCLISHYGIKDFVPHGILEKEFKEDLDLYNFVVYKYKEYHVAVSYKYTIRNCKQIRKVFEYCLPHWQSILQCIEGHARSSRHKIGFYYYIYPVNPFKSYQNFFMTLEEASNYINRNIKYYSYIDSLSKKTFSYFKLVNDYRDGEYYMFRPARFDETIWDFASLVIDKKRMYDSGLKDVLIHFYNEKYNCVTVDIVNWRILEKEKSSHKPSYTEIIKELRPWALNAIRKYGSFDVVLLGNTKKEETDEY